MATTSGAPAETADASSTIRIMQQVGGSFGAAVLAIILAGQLNRHPALTTVARGHAFDTAFWWAIGLIVLALVPALLLPGSLRFDNKRERSSCRDGRTPAVSSRDAGR